MLGLAHVALNIGLCSSMARKPAATPLAIHVRITDSQRTARVNKTFTFRRGTDPHTVIALDMERGTYRLELSAPKFNCGVSDWLVFWPDLDRTVNETLRDGRARPTQPLLILGTLPQSFQTSEPTYLLFDKNAVACNKPIAQPLPADIVSEQDQDAYYAWISPTASIAAKGMDSATIALRLKTPQGDYHYIRIPYKFPQPWEGWPQTIQFNIKEEELLFIQGEPVDTLLCPHFFRTSVG